jgi:hypothetical protein
MCGNSTEAASGVRRETTEVRRGAGQEFEHLPLLIFAEA